MSGTVELTATESAERLLPLLQEYAAKTAAFSERVVIALEKFVTPESNSIGRVRFTATSGNFATPAALEASRLICFHDALDKPVTDLAREASGLIEHAALEYHLRAELKLRLDELEEHIKFSAVMVGELVKYLTAQKDQAALVRKLVEEFRPKAPF